MRLSALLARGRLEREMEDEMRTHLEQATARLIERGMSPKDAAIEARREFGNVTLIEEDARDSRGARWAESLVGDVRFALRFLRRNPVTTTTIVLVLALGIGVNSALFSVIQAITTRPAPGMPEDERHVQIFGFQQVKRGYRWMGRRLSYGELTALAERKETFAGVAGFVQDMAILESKAEGPHDVKVAYVTPNYFTLLGVAPALGHVPLGADREGAAEHDAVISYHLWETTFQRSDTALGAVLRINDMDVRVVGVAPERFAGPVPTQATTALWLPLSARSLVANSSREWLSSPDSLVFLAVGRLAAGVDERQATAVARNIALSANERRSAPGASEAQWRSEVFDLRSSARIFAEEPMAVFMIAGLWAGGLLILLVACTNVSSLLVASAMSRRHEIAVRLSLGASRARVVRQLVTESAMLATAGGLAGLFLYWAVMRVLQARITNADLAPDFGTLGFTLAFAAGTGILFGLSPALHATRADLAGAVKDSGSGTRRSRLQGSFVVAQIALTQPLLVVLAVMLWVVYSGRTDLIPESIASRVVEVDFQMAYGGSGEAARRNRIREVMARVAEQPGVVSIVPEPAGFLVRRVSVAPADRGSGVKAEESRQVLLEGTAPGFFALFDVPILRGRDVELADTLGRQVPVVIPSDVAREFWAESDPIGKRLETNGWTLETRTETGLTATLVVVGVYDADVPTTRGDAAKRVFTAHGGFWQRGRLYVETSGPAPALIPKLRTFLREQAHDAPIWGMRTLSERQENNRLESLRVTAGVATGGALAMLLASIGLYGVVSLAVGQRRREIGVRIALGGQPLRVARMFFASGVKLSVIGLLLGLPLSLIGLRLVADGWTTLEMSFPLLAAGIGAAVLAVASIATWLPARKAATVDPVVALRVE